MIFLCSFQRNLFCLFFFYSFLVCAFFATIVPTSAIETIRIQRESEQEQELIGRIVLKSSDGEQFFQTRDGQIHKITTQEIKFHTSDESPFVPWTQEEISTQLLAEFGSSFRIHTIGPYIIVYNTSEEYAEWVGVHFHRLLRQYHSVWKKFGLALTEPEFPLIAIVFSGKKEFDAYGKRDIGNVIPMELNAYYHKMTNRIVLCDLSGIEQQRKSGESGSSRSRRSERIVKRPGAGVNISAITHEAAHQIGFNNGMFSRIAPIPLWLLEGVAMLHEPSEISNPSRNESGEPKTNQKRLFDLRNALKSTLQPTGQTTTEPSDFSDPIRRLLITDDLLRSTATNRDYYALAWGLTYYLYKQHKKGFSLYLQKMAQKDPYSDDNAALRIEEFESCFGENWNQFYKSFFKFVRTLK